MPSEMIHILLPVHNRREITKRFIDNLRSQTYQNFHLILIDDGSTDGTADMAKASGLARLTVIPGNGKLWWAGALHRGYKWVVAQRIPPREIVCIINDDTEFKQDFLSTAVRLMDGTSRTLMLAQCFSMLDDHLCEEGIHFDPRRLSFDASIGPELTNCLSTKGLFMRAGDFVAIGGFHPVVLPHYLSDYEYTIRAHRKGFTLISHPDLRIWYDYTKVGFIDHDSSDSFGVFLKKYFSRKAKMPDPLRWSCFVVLTCPMYLWPKHFFVIWKRSATKIGWKAFDALRATIKRRLEGRHQGND